MLDKYIKKIPKGILSAIRIVAIVVAGYIAVALMLLLLFGGMMWSIRFLFHGIVYSEAKIEKIVEKSLEKKYHEDFSVLSISTESDGGGTGLPPTYFYELQCTDSNETGPFTVVIYRNGKKMRDNYEGYLYADDIDNEFNQIISPYSKVLHNDFPHEGETPLYPVYMVSEEKYDSFEAYVRNRNVKVCGNIFPNAETKDNAVDAVFGFISDLQENGYRFDFCVNWKNERIFFWDVSWEEKITRQDVEESFERAEEGT